jgi:hypothetical protein
MGLEICGNWVFRKELGKRQIDHGFIRKKFD